jgi:hypothetical protein
MRGSVAAGPQRGRSGPELARRVAGARRPRVEAVQSNLQTERNEDVIERLSGILK